MPDILPIPVDRAIRILDREHGRGVVIEDDRSRHYLWMDDPEALRRPAMPVWHDAVASLRGVAVQRLLSYAAGKRVMPVPPPLRLTAQKVRRLIDELHALDYYLLGMQPREIAALLLDPDARDLRAIEWKSSALRRHVMRLIGEATHLMEGGYRNFLRGGPAKGKAAA